MRLPTPGKDEGIWGNILNDFLLTSHNDDGTLKNISQEKVIGLGADLSTKAQNSAVVHMSGDESVAGVKTFNNTIVAVGDIMADDVSMYQPLASPLNQAAETVISNFQPGHGFVKDSSTGTQIDDTSTFVRGTQSLKLTTNGTGSPCFTTKTISALNLTNTYISIWVKTDQPSRIVQLFVYFSSDGLVGNWFTVKPSDDITALKPNVWTRLTMSQGRNAQFTGSPNLASITSVRVRVQDNATGPVSVWVGGLGFCPNPVKGFVSLTFDDNYRSMYILAKPEMDKYGYRGTMYAIPQRVGLANYTTLDQLKNLHALDWDISNHTFDHINLTTLPPDQIEYQCRKAKNWFRKNGFTKGLEELALPNGGYNDDVVLPIVRKYFRSVRTIVHQVETVPPADHYKLRTCYVTHSTTLASVKAAVDAALTKKEWLILVFHEFVTGTASEPTQWRASDFADLMNYLSTSAATVRTVSEVLNNNALIP